jgi:uncharacterized membrane protein
MKISKLFGLIALTTGIFTIFPEVAKADVEVCNRSDYKAYVAIAYYADGKWNSWGWTHVYSGECETVFEGNARLTPPYLYLADDEWTEWKIGGSSREADFCIRQTAFDIEYADGHCSEEGMFPATFQRITSDDYDLRINLD